MANPPLICVNIYNDIEYDPHIGFESIFIELLRFKYYFLMHIVFICLEVRLCNGIVTKQFGFVCGFDIFLKVYFLEFLSLYTMYFFLLCIEEGS